jgi:hypothetical protein
MALAVNPTEVVAAHSVAAVKLEQHWEEACVELRILRDMIPDKDDPRHVEANNKLIDVEKRLRKEEKRK